MSVEELEVRVKRLEDNLEIMNLQSRYNFYLGMYWGERAVDELFAKNDPDVSTDINGARWFGLDGVRRMFSQLDRVHKEMPGRMGLLMAIQPLINVDKSGDRANGQWYCFGPSALPTKNSPEDEEHLGAMWMFGRYDVDYVKEDGRWKIKKLGFSLHFLSPVGEGWVNCPTPHYVRPFESEAGSKPDQPSTFPHLYKPEGPNTYGPAPPEDQD